jgi:hypothetical protein
MLLWIILDGSRPSWGIDSHLTWFRQQPTYASNGADSI